MNLNQITARIGELSAELLTLHKDLAFLVDGGVTRQTEGRDIQHFRDFRVGDKALLIRYDEHEMLSPSNEFRSGNEYIVLDIEDADYTGRFNVLIESNDGCAACWVNFTILSLVV